MNIKFNKWLAVVLTAFAAATLACGIQSPIVFDSKPTPQDGQLYTWEDRSNPATLDNAPVGVLEAGGNIDYVETGRSDDTYTIKFTVDEGFVLGYRGWTVNGHNGGIVGIVAGPVTEPKEMTISDGAVDLVPLSDVPNYIRHLYVMHCRGFDKPTGSLNWTYHPWDVRTDLLGTTMGDFAKYWPANYPASCPKSAVDEAAFMADPENWAGPGIISSTTSEEEAAADNSQTPVQPVVEVPVVAEPAAEMAANVATMSTQRLATGDVGGTIVAQPGVPFCGDNNMSLADGTPVQDGCWVSLTQAVNIPHGVAGVGLWDVDLNGRVPTQIP